MLTLYGYPGTYVVTNTRPIHPLEVAVGEVDYPTQETLKDCMAQLSKKAWTINASEFALRLGNPLITNIVMTGALLGTGLLPLEKEKVKRQLQMSFKGDRQALNLKAFEQGYGAIRGAG